MSHHNAADKSIPDADKKEDLAQLEAELKNAKPIQFKENIALVVKYFDQLAPFMQAQDSMLRTRGLEIHLAIRESTIPSSVKYFPTKIALTWPHCAGLS